MHPRWRVDISGPDGNEVGDLRFEGSGGSILLQHDDKAFQPLQDLKLGGGHISFTLARTHQRYDGTVSATRLQGTVRAADGTTSEWIAEQLPLKVLIWPIAPRVIFRQLAMGSAATSERMSQAWFGTAADSSLLEREYRDLAGSAAVAPVGRTDRGARSNLLALGLDVAGRTAARGVLEQIGRSDAADVEFRAIFTRDGRWKLDIHDNVLWEAPHYLYGFQLARAGDALRALHELNAEVIDSQAIRQAAWRLWSAAGSEDSVRVFAAIDSLARRDEAAANTMRALLAGFNDSMDWWRRAVSWLLTHPWLETADGPRSPAQLMATFWGVDSLPLPRIETTRFGGVAAMPTLSIWHVGSLLIKPDNAPAEGWLRCCTIEAFRIWRPLRWGETPLTVVTGGRSAIVASPGSQAIVHPAGFFGERDAIRIEPGIMPLAAVAVFLHEWNHLIAAQRRLAGLHPAAVVPSTTQLQLREEDPWLAEGFAEWATDEVLRPAGASAALLRFTQSEKRLGIAASDPEDPHFLGFRLVRAVSRTHRPAVLRELLVTNLHDLNAFARSAGLSAAGAARVVTLQRPATAIVIPEVTFTWVEGTAFDLSRRLVIPNTRSEH